MLQLSSKAIAMSDIGTGSESTDVALQVRPKQVTVPTPVEVNERYLEVRELGTDTKRLIVEMSSYYADSKNCW